MLKKYLFKISTLLSLILVTPSCTLQNQPLGFFALISTQFYSKSNTIQPDQHSAVYFDVVYLPLQKDSKDEDDLAHRIVLKLDQKLSKSFPKSAEKEKVILQISPQSKEVNYEFTKKWVEGIVKGFAKDEKVIQKTLNLDLETLYRRGQCIVLYFRNESGALLEQQKLFILPSTNVYDSYANDAVVDILKFINSNFRSK